MRRSFARLAGVAALATGLTMALSSSAGAEPRPEWVVCHVDVDTANYRDAPDGKILGQAHRGDEFTAYQWVNGWYRGDLDTHWEIWMHANVLDYPCGT